MSVGHYSVVGDSHSHLGHQLKERRQQLQLSQRVLAERIGLSRPAISKIEAGETMPSLVVFFRLIECLAFKAEEIPTLASSVASSARAVLSTLPLQLNGQAVELLELRPDGEVWIALLRPQTPPGAPEATARHVPVAGLILLPAPASRAA